jgi:hypothetical protein
MHCLSIGQISTLSPTLQYATGAHGRLTNAKPKTAETSHVKGNCLVTQTSAVNASTLSEARSHHHCTSPTRHRKVHNTSHNNSHNTNIPCARSCAPLPLQTLSRCKFPQFCSRATPITSIDDIKVSLVSHKDEIQRVARPSIQPD